MYQESNPTYEPNASLSLQKTQYDFKDFKTAPFSGESSWPQLALSSTLTGSNIKLPTFTGLSLAPTLPPVIASTSFMGIWVFFSFFSLPNLSYPGCVRDVQLITPNKSGNFGDLWGELEIGMWRSSAGRTASNNSRQESWAENVRGTGDRSDGEEGTASAHLDFKMALLSLFVS